MQIFLPKLAKNLSIFFFRTIFPKHTRETFLFSKFFTRDILLIAGWQWSYFPVLMAVSTSLIGVTSVGIVMIVIGFLLKLKESHKDITTIYLYCPHKFEKLSSSCYYNYMRNIKFAIKEFYHIYNRGVDKRNIFMNSDDVNRFLFCMLVFNTEDPVGSIYLNFLEKKRKQKLRSSAPHKSKKLVNFVAYCLNQNHYHFILEPLVEDGVQKFMHKLSTGYTNFFNEKYKRSGSLFQGKYKAIHVSSNEYLLYLSVYVNCNYKVHRGLNKKWMSGLSISSFREYVGKVKKPFCFKDIILEQFGSLREYENYCGSTLSIILEK